nr:sporulation protein [Geobacillus sp. FW23]
MTTVLLRKMMSRVGVGSAHVDLILNKSLWRQGEMIQGIVHIYGGTVEQRIERLDVELVQKTIENGKELDAIVAVIPAAGAFWIKPSEKKSQSRLCGEHFFGSLRALSITS